MADFYIPKDEDTVINLHCGDDTPSIPVDIASIHSIVVEAYDQSEKSNTPWQDHFAVAFQAQYGVRLNKTVISLLVKEAQEMTERLKKSCFQSPSSISDTISPSPNE